MVSVRICFGSQKLLSFFHLDFKYSSIPPSIPVYLHHTRQSKKNYWTHLIFILSVIFIVSLIMPCCPIEVKELTLFPAHASDVITPCSASFFLCIYIYIYTYILWINPFPTHVCSALSVCGFLYPFLHSHAENELPVLDDANDQQQDHSQYGMGPKGLHCCPPKWPFSTVLGQVNSSLTIWSKHSFCLFMHT